MTGEQIYNKYRSFRDYSGSPEDEYAQLLDTIQGQYLGDGSPDGRRASFFRLLEQAESQGKKLSVKDPFPDNPNICWDDISHDMIEFV